MDTRLNTTEYTQEFLLGKESEERFFGLKRRQGNIVIENKGDYAQLCKYDCTVTRRHLWSLFFPNDITYEIKCDLYAKDRLCIEWPTLDHTEADRYVFEYWEPYNFHSVPTKTLRQLVDKDRERITRGEKPRHYTGQAGHYHYMSTFLPIKELINLTGYQPENTHA